MTQPDAISITVRPAVLQDIDVLLDIDRQCFPPGIAYPYDEIAWLLRSPSIFTLVAEHSQQIAGFIALQFHTTVSVPVDSEILPDPQIRGELITIDVSPEFRRRHVGWQLYHALEQEFCRRRGKIIRLHVAVNNAAAIAFYRRLNYRVIGQVSRYYLDSIDALRMERIMPADVSRTTITPT